MGIRVARRFDELKELKELVDREVGTVMGPCSTTRNIEKLSGTTAIVNESGRLIGLWHKSHRMKPQIAKENTKIKVIIDKLESPVVVVDRHRKPIGLVTKKDVMLAAEDVQEYTTPVFYSGLDTIPNAGEFKSITLNMVEKISKIAKPRHATVRVSHKGVWKINIKLSTSLRTFVVESQKHDCMSALKECLRILEEEVIEEKEKRLKFRQ